MWFRYESGVVAITPKLGSKYAGQRITLTGYGFAPLESGADGSMYDEFSR